MNNIGVSGAKTLGNGIAAMSKLTLLALILK